MPLMRIRLGRENAERNVACEATLPDFKSAMLSLSVKQAYGIGVALVYATVSVQQSSQIKRAGGKRNER